MDHDVFISYGSEDKPIEDGVCPTLENEAELDQSDFRHNLTLLPYWQAATKVKAERRVP
jgi:hypothetical protein